MDVEPFLLRLTVELTLAAHGALKLFGWFGGPGLNGTGQFFEMLGFHPGRRHALLAGLAETVGGLLLALGLITPLGSAAIISVMLVAIYSVHMQKGFFAQNGGYEYNLVLAVAALTLAFTGSGSLSADAMLKQGDGGAFTGLVALVAGILGAVISLAQRKPAPMPSAAATK